MRLLIVALLALPLRLSDQQPASNPASRPTDEPRFTSPPESSPSPEIEKRLVEITQQLSAGTSSVDSILADATKMDLHAWPQFRKLIRDNAPTGRIVIISPSEAGVRLLVRGCITDDTGTALSYAHQTSAKGWYSDLAPHISGNSGDVKHARLFGYVRTDGKGQFELETIRPAGYPRSDLPCHIHVAVDGSAGQTGGGEILFDDDPRLTPAHRKRVQGTPDVIATVDVLPDGSQRCAATLVVRNPKR